MEAPHEGASTRPLPPSRSRWFSVTTLPVLAVAGVEALEDAAQQSAQVVTAIGPGAPYESGQAVTLSLTTDHAELFTTPPTLTQSGVLTFTPAPDAFGVATATVTAHDDGGTANSGDDTTTASFTVTLDPVNDAPSFVAGGNVTVLANAGPQSVSWAGGVSPGHRTRQLRRSRSPTTAVDPSLFRREASRSSGRTASCRSRPRSPPTARPR